MEIPEPKVGQIYTDAMFDGKVEVTSIDEIAVFITDVEIEHSSGSPYPHEMWEENVECGRFKLLEDVDKEEREEVEEENSEESESPSEPEEDQVQEEVEEEDSEESEKKTFKSQDALSW